MDNILEAINKYKPDFIIIQALPFKTDHGMEITSKKLPDKYKNGVMTKTKYTEYNYKDTCARVYDTHTEYYRKKQYIYRGEILYIIELYNKCSEYDFPYLAESEYFSKTQYNITSYDHKTYSVSEIIINKEKLYSINRMIKDNFMDSIKEFINTVNLESTE